MAIISYGYSGSIGWAEWATIATRLGADYWVGSDTAFRVTDGLSGTVNVAAGTAGGCGIFDISDSVVNVPITADGWSTVVLERDWRDGPGTEVTRVVALTSGASQAISALRQANPGTLDHQPLALVQRVGGLVAQVIDLRVWVGNGGVLAASTDALAYLGRGASRVRVGNQVWWCPPDGAGWQPAAEQVDAAQIVGTLDAGRIPSLSAGAVTSGVFALARIPQLTVAKLPTKIPASRLDGTIPASQARVQMINDSAGSETWTGSGARNILSVTVPAASYGRNVRITSQLVVTSMNGAYRMRTGLASTTPQDVTLGANPGLSVAWLPANQSQTYLLRAERVSGSSVRWSSAVLSIDLIGA